MSKVKNRFIHNSKDKNKPFDFLVISSRPLYRQKTRGCQSMFNYKGEPVIKNQIEEIGSYNKEIQKYISVGFDCNKFIKFRPDHIRIIENVLYETTNIVEDLRLYFNNSVGESLFLSLGNVVFSRKILSKINRDISTIYYCNEEEEDPRILRDNNDLIRMNYESNIKDIWSGICYITGREYELLKKYCKKKNNNKLFVECINYIIDNGGYFQAIEGKVEKL